MKQLLLTLCVFTIIFYSCKKDDDNTSPNTTPIDNTDTTKTTTDTSITIIDTTNSDTNIVITDTIVKIGDFKFGGIVFWINPNYDKNADPINYNPYTHTRGFVCAISDTIGISGCAKFSGSDDGTDIISSMSNNRYGCKKDTSAVSICSNLRYGGYSDWILPSRDALLEMGKIIPTINTVSKQHGGNALYEGTLTYESEEYPLDYLSSTSNYNNFPRLPPGVSVIILKEGYVRAYGAGKDMYKRIRAIRAF